MVTRREIFGWTLTGFALAATGNYLSSAKAQGTDIKAAKLIAAAKTQIGVTTIYDPAYVGLSFPMGDVPRERGVCTDVVIRAYRDAFGYDLQSEVNRDMKASFSRYPQIWGHKGADKNIDHRRVPNLETFLTRKGAALPVTDQGKDYLPGDLITQRLPGNLPHIAIITADKTKDETRPLVVHNVGAGAALDDTLFTWPVVGHFRFYPA